MDNEKQPAPSSNTSDTRKGYNEPNPAQPNGANELASDKLPTETEKVKDKKDKPVIAEKKLHGR